MSRWLVLLLLLSTGGLWPRVAQGLPPPPADQRAEWEWTALSVHHGLLPDQIDAHAPYVPADAPRQTGPVVLEPGRVVVVWMSSLSTVRVRKTTPRSPGRLRFWRVEPGANRSQAWVEEAGLSVEPGVWLLRHPVGRAAPWLIETTRRTEIVVERAVPRRGNRIWETVHDEVLDWVDERTALPRLPARPGGERYLRRRLADRAIVENVEQLDGTTPEVRDALAAWRRIRASAELDALRPLARSLVIAPASAPEVVVPHRRDAMTGQLTEEDAERQRLVRLSNRPWRFGLRGPGVLHIRAHALMPADGPAQRRLSIVVRSRDDTGLPVVLAQYDAVATPARVRDTRDPDAPIPTMIDAVTDTGERVSLEHALAVPLRSGKHDYQVEIRGGDVALRAWVGQVSTHAHGRSSSRWRSRQRRRALARIDDQDTPAADVARVLLHDRFDGPPESIVGPASVWPLQIPRVAAYLRLQQLQTQPLDDARRHDRLEDIAASLSVQRDPDVLDVELAIEVFEQWMATGDPDRAVESLRHHAHQLNADELPKLVEAVTDPERTWPLLEALDAVEERAPLAERLRRAHTTLWTWTQWVRLRPEQPPPAWKWIEPPPPPSAHPSPHKRSLWSFPVGRAVTLMADPHPYESERTPVLRLRLHADDPIDDVVTLRIDGQRFAAPVSGHAEIFEAVVPVGPHEVRLDAPMGVTATSNLRLPPGDPLSDRPGPRRTTMWPIAIGDEPVVFDLGTLPRDPLVQVDLRLVDPSDPFAPPVDAWICSNDGTRRLVTLHSTERATDLVAMRDAPPASARMQVVVPVDRVATRLWVETESDQRLALAAKIRRWEPPLAPAPVGRPRPLAASTSSSSSKSTPSSTTSPTPSPAPPAGDSSASPDPSADGSSPSPDTGSPSAASSSADATQLAAAAAPDPYPDLAMAIRQVVASPGSVEHRLDLGHRLLDVGNTLRAREQLQHVMERVDLTPTDPRLPAIQRLQARIDAFITDDFVELSAPPTGPIMLRPTTAAVPRRAPQWPTVAQADTAAREGRLVESFEAHTQAYMQTGIVGPGYAASLALAEALRNAPDGASDPELAPLLPLAYGLTSRMRAELGTPTLRWLHTRALTATRWEPLRLAEHAAGTRNRGIASEQQPVGNSLKFHWALLAPPWGPTEGRILRPGSKAVFKFTLREASNVSFQVFCDDRTRPRDDIPVLMRVGDPSASHVEQTLEITPRRVFPAALPEPDTSIRVELSLRDTDHPEQRCSVRWTLDNPDATSAPATRPMQWLLAEPRSPVEVIVLGPSTIRAQILAEDPDEPTMATVIVSDLDGSPHHTVSIPVGTPGAPAGISEAVVLVQHEGPQRIRVQADQAPMLVRLAARRTVTVAPPDAAENTTEDNRLTGPRSDVSLGTAYERARAYWPAGIDARASERILDAAAGPGSRVGTFETALGFSRTDIAEADDPRPRNRVRGTLRWRRELLPSHVWIRLDGHGQWRDGAGGAGGGGATVYAQRGSRKIRGRLSVTGWSETYGGGPAWSLRTTGLIDRPLNVTPSVILIPYARLSYRHQSLNEADVDLDAEPSHAQVYSQYVEDHPLAPRAGARVRWFIFDDLQLISDASITPNSTIRTIDHVDADLGLQGIIDTRRPLLVRYGGAYDLSLRIEDNNRMESFLRHGPRINAGLTYIIGRVGRLNLDARDTVYLSRPFAPRNSFEVVLSFELTLGRGIRDTSPMELLFRPFYRYQWWRPPATEARR